MSSSKSSQSTSQLDNRRTQGEGAISAENSSVNVWNTSLDSSIVNRALGSVDTVSGQALSFGSDALGLGSEALGFGKQALATSANTFSDALGFADSLSARTNTTVSNALSDALGSALSFMSGESGRNNATLSNTFSDALGFADSQAGRTNATLSNTFADALGFADAQAARTNSSLFSAFSDLLGAQESQVGKVLNYGGTMTDKVLDSVAASTSLVKDAYEDAKGRGALTDKMIMAAIAAMALVAYMAVKK